MTVSVIIVNWNTRELTCAAVASVLAQETEAALDVIVVDNGSADDSVPVLRERFPGIRVIPTGRNLGFSGGNNVGLQRTRGEFTLLLNSDAELREGALQTLLDAAREHPEAAACQPKLFLPDGSVQLAWDYVPSLIAEPWLVLWYARQVRSPRWQARVKAWREPRAVKAVGLTAVLVPTWVWARIGLLATEPFLFFEEMDFSLRLRRAGLPMWLVPAAEVDHRMGQSMRRVPHVKRRAHYLSRMWFYDTHRDRASAAVVRGLTALRAGAGLLRAGDDEADQLWRPVLRAALRR